MAIKIQATQPILVPQYFLLYHIALYIEQKEGREIKETMADRWGIDISDQQAKLIIKKLKATSQGG